MEHQGSRIDHRVCSNTEAWEVPPEAAWIHAGKGQDLNATSPDDRVDWNDWQQERTRTGAVARSTPARRDTRRQAPLLVVSEPRND